MNDLIKDLATQSIVENISSDRWVFNDAELEKFAELIVRECMEQVWYTREDGINGNVSEIIKERMKKHFGVEE